MKKNLKKGGFVQIGTYEQVPANKKIKITFVNELYITKYKEWEKVWSARCTINK